MSEPAKKPKLFCAKCGRKLADKEALVHKNIDGKREIICHDCFKDATGVDYKTFLCKRVTLFAAIFCFAAERSWENV